jgi:hypothetical protein
MTSDEHFARQAGCYEHEEPDDPNFDPLPGFSLAMLSGLAFWAVVARGLYLACTGEGL